MKILLTNPIQRKTFDCYNILRKYYEPKYFLILHEKHESFLLDKIYKNAMFFPIEKTKEDALLSLCELGETVIFIPLKEEWIDVVLKNSKKIGVNFKYILPENDLFHLVRNKINLSIWCKENLINIPERIIKNVFDMELVIKPSIGSGSKGVKMLHSKSIDLGEVDLNKYLVQERIPNSSEVVGGFYFAKNGTVLSFYSHERLRTYPEKGGVSLYSKSSQDDLILKEGEKILKKLNWNGLIMIEFILDERDNKLKLIEINPRLWGSILLSEFSGNHMLYNYVQECLLKDQIKDSFNKKKLRWVFPFEYKNIFLRPINPIHFIYSKKDTCYINSTYSDFFSSLVLKFLQFKKTIKNNDIN